MQDYTRTCGFQAHNNKHVSTNKNSLSHARIQNFIDVTKSTDGLQ